MKTIHKLGVIGGVALLFVTPAIAFAKGPVISTTDFVSFLLTIFFL